MISLGKTSKILQRELIFNEDFAFVIEWQESLFKRLSDKKGTLRWHLIVLWVGEKKRWKIP